MNHRVTVSSLILTLVSACCVVSGNAQISETKFVPGDGEAGDYFGRSVSLSGNFALVGASYDDDNGAQSGSAYIFHFDGSNWIEQAKLTASDGASTDYFGQSVSLSGDYAIIGAHLDDDNGNSAGAAYIFHYDGSNWVEQTKLIASEGDPYDFFGFSVSISGNFALVGAYSDNDIFYSAGSAYMFYNNGLTWVEQAKLVASDAGSEALFGTSVALSGDLALIGAPYSDNSRGSAYVFHYDGASWTEQRRLSPSDGERFDHFGRSVSLSGNHAIIGAPQDEDHNKTGAAYIFRKEGSTWTHLSTLSPSDVAPLDFFGWSVSISGDYALVGASGDGASRGSVYVYHNIGMNWVQETKIVASDNDINDFFGLSVSLSGNYALVGAYGDDANASGAGAAYVYSAASLCSKVSQFQARCRPGGLIKARVTMADASHAGDVIEISIDDVPYEVTIDATGRGQLSQGGFSSGPHTVELTNPGQCFDPIVVTCGTGLDEEVSGDWDDELISESPTETALLGNYPNPFNPSTTIRYTLSNDGPVSIRVYNMLGQEVATLVDGFQKAGEQSVTWHGVNNFGQSVASGLYIYRLQTGNVVLSQKMLFTK